MSILQEIEMHKNEGSIIETPRLLIREFRPEDVEAYFGVLSDPDVTRFVHWDPHSSLNQTRNFISRVIDHRKRNPRVNYEFALELKSSQVLIGYTILQVDTLNRSAERGIFLKKSEWNKGLGTEAQSGMLDYGFGQLGLHRIWSKCDPENTASIKMIQKTGMKYEGRHREDVWVPRNQAYRDSLLFSILENEWRAQRLK